MGGSTFPVPVNEGGSKVFFDTIFKLSLADGKEPKWTLLKQRLPEPMAEGISVSLDKGSLIIGGSGDGKLLNRVYRTDWDSTNSRILFTDYPELPTACFNPAATVWKNKVYLAGGHDGTGGIHNFWLLDLNKPHLAWENLPAWPGPKRFGATLEVLSDGKNDYIYLFTGKTESTNPRSQDNYLKDVYRFDPITEEWEQLGDMPRAALIGVPGKLDKSTLAIFSGSDGHDIDRLEEIGEAYRLPNDILVYNATTDSWSMGGKMPLGQIGVPMLPTDTGFILASGEYSPGLRSNKVYNIKVKGPTN